MVDKVEIKAIRSDFYDLFKTTFSLRNTLLHKTFSWTGEHLDLQLQGFEFDSGRILIDVKTGTKIELQEILSKQSKKYVYILSGEGKKMKIILQKICDILDR